jgi:transketolase
VSSHLSTLTYSRSACICTPCSNKLPAGWENALPSYTPEDKGLATRQYSQIMLNALAPVLPGLIGGSADLAPSNLTLMKMFGDFQKGSYEERNMRWGLFTWLEGLCVVGVFAHWCTSLVQHCNSASFSYGGWGDRGLNGL